MGLDGASVRARGVGAVPWGGSGGRKRVVWNRPLHCCLALQYGSHFPCAATCMPAGPTSPCMFRSPGPNPVPFLQNGLTGTVPASLATAPGLVQVSLSLNNLSGGCTRAFPGYGMLC